MKSVVIDSIVKELMKEKKPLAVIESCKVHKHKWNFASILKLLKFNK